MTGFNLVEIEIDEQNEEFDCNKVMEIIRPYVPCVPFKVRIPRISINHLH